MDMCTHAPGDVPHGPAAPHARFHHCTQRGGNQGKGKFEKIAESLCNRTMRKYYLRCDLAENYRWTSAKVKPEKGKSVAVRQPQSASVPAIPAVHGCPNRTNPFHACTAYCLQYAGGCRRCPTS